MTELEHFRAQKDAFFKTHPQSPLTAEQQAAFHGLRYFPENAALRLVLPLEPFADKDSVVMQTSTGDARTYTRTLTIKLNEAGYTWPRPDGTRMPFHKDGVVEMLQYPVYLGHIQATGVTVENAHVTLIISLAFLIHSTRYGLHVPAKVERVPI